MVTINFKKFIAIFITVTIISQLFDIFSPVPFDWYNWLNGGFSMAGAFIASCFFDDEKEENKKGNKSERKGK